MLERQARVACVDRPWLKNRRWAGGRVRDESSKYVFFSVLLGVIFGTIAVRVSVAAWHGRAEEPALLVVAGLLVALAGAMTAWAVRQVRVRVRFGRSVLELETLPGVTGGWLAGVVRAPAWLEAPRGVRVELDCVARARGNGRNAGSGVREEVRLHGEQRLAGALSRDDDSVRIPVAFAIPAGAPPCGRLGRETILWRVRVRAALDGPDYDATFTVPVFDVPGGSEGPVPRAEEVAAGLRKSQTCVGPPRE